MWARRPSSRSMNSLICYSRNVVESPHWRGLCFLRGLSSVADGAHKVPASASSVRLYTGTWKINSLQFRPPAASWAVLGSPWWPFRFHSTQEKEQPGLAELTKEIRSVTRRCPHDIGDFIEKSVIQRWGTVPDVVLQAVTSELLKAGMLEHAKLLVLDLVYRSQGNNAAISPRNQWLARVPPIAADEALYASVVAAFAQNREWQTAGQLMEQMERIGLSRDRVLTHFPDGRTAVGADVFALVNKGMFEKAEEVLIESQRRAKNPAHAVASSDWMMQFPPSTAEREVWLSVITAYSGQKQWVNAARVYDRMLDDTEDDMSYILERLFEHYQKEGFQAFMEAFVQLQLQKNDTGRAYRALRTCHRSAWPASTNDRQGSLSSTASSTRLWAMIIAHHVLSGKWESVARIFRVMVLEFRVVLDSTVADALLLTPEPAIVSHQLNALMLNRFIKPFAISSQSDKAQLIHDKLSRDYNIATSPSLLKTLMFGYCKDGKMDHVERLRREFEAHFRLQDHPAIFRWLVKGYCKTGRLGEARKVLEQSEHLSEQFSLEVEAEGNDKMLVGSMSKDERVQWHHNVMRQYLLSAALSLRDTENTYDVLSAMLASVSMEDRPNSRISAIGITADGRSSLDPVYSDANHCHTTADSNGGETVASTGEKLLFLSHKMYGIGTVHDLNEVVRAYAQLELMGDAERVVEKARSVLRIRPNITTLNNLIQGYATLNQPSAMKQARAHFDACGRSDRPQDWRSSVVPDKLTFKHLIQGSCRIRRTDKAMELLELMQSHVVHIEPTQDIFHLLLEGFCAAYQFRDAEALLQAMQQRFGLKPTNSTFSMLLFRYARRGKVQEMENLLNEMTTSYGLKPDQSILHSIVRGLVQKKRVGHAERMIAFLKDKFQLQPNINCVNLMVRAWCNRKNPEEARNLLQHMEERYGVKPNIKSYGTLIAGLVQNGFQGEVDAVLESMPFKPNVYLYSPLLKHACKQRDWPLVEAYVRKIDELGMSLDVYLWNQIILFAWKTSGAKGREEIYNRMQSLGVRPNAHTFRILRKQEKKPNDGGDQAAERNRTNSQDYLEQCTDDVRELH